MPDTDQRHAPVYSGDPRFRADGTEHPFESFRDPRYRELILYKTYADLREEAVRSYAGYLWWIVEPGIQMLTYFLVFGYFLGRGGEDFVPFLLVGVVAWRWFHQSVTEGANSLIASQELIRQIYLPKLIFPTVSVLGNTVKFAVVWLLLLVILRVAGYEFTGAHLLLPLVLFAQLLFIAGAAYLVAPLVPFVPDLRTALISVLQALMFLSAVFYPLEVLPEFARFVLNLNPVAVTLECYRDILLRGQVPPWNQILFVLLSAVLLFCAGATLVSRLGFRIAKLP